VPFLDEEESLPVPYSRLRAVLEKEPEEFELLLVDDGSRDGSPAWAAACAERDPRVRLILLSRNFAHQLAITAGKDHADGDAHAGAGLHRFGHGLTCWVGFPQSAVPYERAPRHAGVTKSRSGRRRGSRGTRSRPSRARHCGG
jgi:hypothetical protein